MAITTASKKWDWEITGHSTWWGSSIRELWSYRNLLARLVRRDFLINYQQTILGPLWILLQPILTLLTFVLVFGKLVRIPTGNVDPVLFYLAGIVLWNFFSDSFTANAFTFTFYAHVFNKVYFPRLIIPLSILSSHFIRFVVQLVLLLLVMAFYFITGRTGITINAWIFFVPIAIILTALFSLAIGLIFSVLTAKYRDLVNVVHLGIRLFMFVTPVIYPLATVPPKVKWIVDINPLTSLFEVFRFALFGEGNFTGPQLWYSIVVILFLFIISLLVFNKQGDQLMDVV